jgi:hypothetical protein
MNFFEAEFNGFRKAVEFGDHELDTWLFWVDILQFLRTGTQKVLIKPYYKHLDIIQRKKMKSRYHLAGLYFI